MLTDYALSFLEKKKLQHWLKSEHKNCNADKVRLSFRKDEVYAICSCKKSINLSLGIHKNEHYMVHERSTSWPQEYHYIPEEQKLQKYR
jgi:hypothetical protein